jgi:hypothetical protein
MSINTHIPLLESSLLSIFPIIVLLSRRLLFIENHTYIDIYLSTYIHTRILVCTHKDIHTSSAIIFTKHFPNHCLTISVAAIHRKRFTKNGSNFLVFFSIKAISAIFSFFFMYIKTVITL